MHIFSKTLDSFHDLFDLRYRMVKKKQKKNRFKNFAHNKRSLETLKEYKFIRKHRKRSITIEMAKRIGLKNKEKKKKTLIAIQIPINRSY